ncbi:unnamed protein product, partial [Mesorhabditis spiculigera]
MDVTRDKKKCYLELALWQTSEILAKNGHGLGTVGQPKSTKAFVYKIWSVRFQLLWGLKKYTELADEMQPFEELDAPDLYYQYFPENGGRIGSMIPFAFRLIHAEILRFTPYPTGGPGH